MHARLLLGLAIGWVVVVTALLVSTWNSGQLLIREVSDEHLEYEARLIVEDIEQELQLRFDALQRLSALLGPAYSHSPSEMRTELSHNDALLALFDGLVVIDREGQVLADWPVVEGRQGLDVTLNEYYQFQRQVGRPHVSEPFFGRATREPTVMFSVPLADAQGRFAGMVGGLVNVLEGSFFKKLKRFRIGQEGFAAVVTASGRVLVHPDNEWILRSTPTAEQNPWLDLALSGWQGTVIGPLLEGEMALQAYRQIWPASWVVGVFVPQAQAFAPLQWFVRHLWLVGAVTVVAMLILLWWLLRLALAPLHRLERQIAAIGQGEREWVELPSATTELSRVVNTFNGVVEKQNQAENSLLDRQAFLDAVLASSPVGMFVCNLDGKLRYVNPAMSQLTGYDLEACQQQGLAAHLHPDDRDHVLELWNSTLLTGQEYQRQHRYLTAGGETIWVEAHARLVRLPDGRPLGFVGMLKDVTQHREMAALQRWEAEHDPLTGLLNRRGFERRMDEAVADWLKKGTSSALVLFDLDHFKPINDEGGHALGDEMLRLIAQAVSARVRKSDYLARYGGDEFALLMTGCDLEQARHTAESLREAVEALHVEHDGKRYRVTLSLGVTTLREGDEESETPMQRADQASYRAKAQGRNRVEVDLFA